MCQQWDLFFSTETNKVSDARRGTTIATPTKSKKFW